MAMAPRGPACVGAAQNAGCERCEPCWLPCWGWASLPFPGGRGRAWPHLVGQRLVDAPQGAWRVVQHQLRADHLADGGHALVGACGAHPVDLRRAGSGGVMQRGRGCSDRR